MSKTKVFLLCLISAVLGVGITFSSITFSHKDSPSSLVVTTPSLVNKGGVVDIEANVSNPSWFLSTTVYQWKVLDKDGELKYNSISDKHIYFPAGLNSGKFFVITSAVNYHNYVLWGGVKALEPKVSIVTVGDPTPGPGPGPGPDPNPTPTPTPVTKDHLIAILIHDSLQDNSLTPEQLALKNSQTIQTKLKQLDTDWKIYDKANPALAKPEWQAAISKAGLPGLFIVNTDGKQFNIGNEKVSTETSTIAAVQKLRGM